MLLGCLVLLARGTLNIIGNYPGNIEMLKSRKSTVHLIESQLLSERPEGIPERCSIEARIHDFSVIPGDRESTIDVAISPQYLSKRTVAASLRDRGFTAVISNDVRAKYSVVSYNASLPVAELRSDMTFMRELREVFYVYSSDAQEVCGSVEGISIVGYLVMLLVIVAVIAFCTRRKIDISGNFWYVTRKDNGNVLKSVRPREDVDLFNFNYRVSTAQDGNVSFAIRTRRKEETCSFVMMGSLNIGDGNRLVIRWIDNPSEHVKCSLVGKFESDDLQVKQAPVVKFLSHRVLRPAEIEFELSGHVNGMISLPFSVLMPFQPTSSYVSNAAMLFEQISTMHEKEPFGRNNFCNAFEFFCRHGSVAYGLMFVNEKLMYAYRADDLETLDDDAIAMIPRAVRKRSGFYYDNQLLPDGSECFVESVNAVSGMLDMIIVVSMREPVRDPLYRMSGIPALVSACVTVYLLSVQEQFRHWFNEVIAILSENNRFLIAEMSRDFTKCYFIQTNCTSSRTKEQFNMRSIAEILGRGPQDAQELTNWLLNELNANGSVKNHLIHGAKGGCVEWGSLSAVPCDCLALQQKIVTLFGQDVSLLKKKEQDHLVHLGLIEECCRWLRIERFTDLNEIKEKLGDEWRLNVLESGGRVAFKTDDRWSAAFWNGTDGFVCDVDDLVDKETNVNGFDKMILGMTTVYWVVDVRTRKVGQLFNWPTIWDGLSVERNCVFDTLADFIAPEQRATFQEHIDRLFDGTEQSWIENVRMLVLGGEYAWVKIALLRRGEQIIGVALNVNERTKREIEMQQGYRTREENLRACGTMIWLFKDSNEMLDEEEIGFHPGISKKLKTNWRFVEDYVAEEDKEMLTIQLKSALKSGDAIDLTTTLKFKEPKRVVLQGKLSPTSGDIIGLCYDISDLWHDVQDLDEAIRRVKEEKEMENERGAVNYSDNLEHVANIVGLTDVLLLRAFCSSQVAYLNIISNVTRMMDEIVLKAVKGGNVDTGRVYFKFMESLESVINPIACCYMERGVELVVETHGVMPEAIVANQQQIEAACMILIHFVLASTERSIVKLKIDTIITEGMLVVELHLDHDKPASEALKAILDRICRSFSGVYVCTVEKIGFRFKVSEFDLPEKNIAGTSIVLYTKNSGIRQQISEYGDKTSMKLKVVSSSEEYTAAIVNEKPELVIVDDDISVSVTCARESAPYVVHISKRLQQWTREVHGVFVVGQLKRAVNRVRKTKLERTGGNSFRSTIHMEVIERNVLVVVNDSQFQRVFCLMLGSLGCTCKVVNTGESALDELEEAEYDCVFVEAELEVLSGPATTKIIRQSPKPYAKMPIFGICGSQEMVKKCNKAGMTSVLPKPIRIHNISDALRVSMRE